MSDNNKNQEIASNEEQAKVKKYDLFVLFPNLSDEDAKLSIAEVKKIFDKFNIKLVPEGTQTVEKRKLSYSIKTAKHGLYVNFVLLIPVEVIDEFKKELEISEALLRFELSVHEPAKVMPVRTGRNFDKKKEGAPVKTEADKKPESAKKEKVSIQELNEKLEKILDSDNEI